MTDPMGSAQLEGMKPARSASAAASPEQPEGPDFESIFEDEFDYVWFTLRRFGVASNDVEDLTHEVFIQVYKHFDQYDAARPMRPWLFGFAYRIACGYRRLARHRVEALDERADRATDPSPSAADHLATRQRLELAWDALQHLDLDQRAVFILHEIEECPIPEVAETLRIPRNTAYSRLRLARAQFAKTLHRLGAQRGAL